MRGTNTNVIVGALYHHPSPIYQTTALLDYIENSAEEINTKFPQAAVVLAGDLNALSDTEIISRTSLISIVDQPDYVTKGRFPLIPGVLAYER